MIAIILILVFLWMASGTAMVVWNARVPKGKLSIRQVVEKRICVVGDEVPVKLICSTADFPAMDLTNVVMEPWDVVLLIDRSSSMGFGSGSALAEAKQAALTMVKSLPVDFRFSVFQFDHDAQEIVRLSFKGSVVEKAIDQISSGGATDIAYVLELAAQSLHNESKILERKQAVILLSDGGSDRDSSIEAAAKLKQQPNLTLFTVSIGDADNYLMQVIASDEKCAFKTDDITEISNLYAQIGNIITGQSATEVKIDSSFNHLGPWALKQWGEMLPIHQQLNNGQFGWILPTLDEQEIEFDFTLAALKPGWHRVSLNQSTLETRWQQQTISRQTNTYPRVLVLPAIPGWQLLWVIFNPLWYYLKHLLSRHTEPTMVQEEGPPSKVNSQLTLPSALEVPKTPLPTLKVKPTLVIGLGFGGTHSLLHCKRLVWERGNRIDQQRIRYLAVDTASPEFFPSPSIGTITLAEDERLHLDAPLEPYLKDLNQQVENVQPWLNVHSLVAGGARPDLHQGMSNQRALGRLAALLNQSKLTQILQVIFAQLSELTTQGDSSIDIIITGTSGGGTSSGMVLDLCWLIRQLLAQRASSAGAITLMLSAPYDQQTNGPEDALRSRNHMALMRELDRIDALRSEPLAPNNQSEAMRNWFDQVFCIGPSVMQSWSAQTVLYPKTGEMIFSWLAAGGTEDLQQHFMQVKRQQANKDNKDGCLIQRVDPNSHYLYPKTVKRYLAVEVLRRFFTTVLQPCNADEQKAPALLEYWKTSMAWYCQTLPWVLGDNGFDNSEQMNQRLRVGAGPSLHHGVTPLGYHEFHKLHRLQVAEQLDQWIEFTLNQGVNGICQRHEMTVIVASLQLLATQLTRITALAQPLLENSYESMVKSEADLIIVLIQQTQVIIEHKVAALTAWEKYLGEGIKHQGVKIYIDQQAAMLAAELAQLNQQNSPNLPVTQQQLDQIGAHYMTEPLKELVQRMMWQRPQTQGGRHWLLVLQATERHDINLESRMPLDNQVNTVAEIFIELVMNLAGEFEHWQLHDALIGPLPAIHHDKPRTNGLNPQAKGCYIYQGQKPMASLDCEVILSSIVEPQHEQRLIVCEQNIASQLLWPNNQFAADLSYIFDQEFFGYYGYALYCQNFGLVSASLPASLLALCHQPQKLINFVACGLIEGLIINQSTALQPQWIVKINEQPTFLAEHGADGLGTFIRVASAWISQDFNRPTGEIALSQLKETLLQHPLLKTVSDQDWLDKFIAVVWGLIKGDVICR